MKNSRVWYITFLQENKVNIILWIFFLFIYFQNRYTSFGYFFAKQFVLMAFMTIGVSIEMLCGDFDLSFAAQIAASTVLAAYFLRQGGSLWLAIILVIGFHALAGVWKGFLMAKIRIPSIIMTLALQVIFTNLFAVLTEGNSIMFNLGKNYYSDLHFKVIIYLILFLMLTTAIIFMNHTYYGRYCRMIGEDMDLTERSGLNHVAILIIIHVLASLFFSIPAVIMMLQTSSGSTTLGTNYLYKVLAAACLGGIGYQNGKGKISGMLMGTITMILLMLLLTGSGYLSRWESIIEGVIILSAVLTKRYKNNN